VKTIEQLAADFQSHEEPSARGPHFVKLLLEIESVMNTSAITREQLLSWLGRPDFFDVDGPNGTFVYIFDHHEPGSNRDEWYLHLEKGRLFRSGYNRSGINDLSDLKPRSEFPS
jgi:hypothetical protein